MAKVPVEKDTEKPRPPKEEHSFPLKQMEARRGKVWPVTLQGTPANPLVVHEPQHGCHRCKTTLANISSHKQVSVHAN